MAAGANPSRGGHRSGNNNVRKSNGRCKANANSAGDTSAKENSVADPEVVLRHNSGLSLDWTPEEQSLLEDLLAKYASESNIVRYAKISLSLRDKTTRDVALRCRWMSKKKSGKRRKDDNSRKSKDKKEKITDSLPRFSQVANRFNDPPYAQSMMSMDSDDGISFNVIGGAAGQLLEQNARALDQISANVSACKIHENFDLFCQARSNILSILNEASNMSEIMKQMPPLPVKLNDDLANSVLPRTFPPKRP